MNTLELELETSAGSRPLSFTVRRMVNVGYAGRNQAAVRAHIDELREQGVPPPPSVPYCIPVAARNITTAEEIEVLPGRTSGEAEVAFFLDGGRIYVGVGSDHTDRELEAQSIAKSKQICPNVVSRRVWLYEDVAESWDRLVLQSLVSSQGGPERPYQRAALEALLPPHALLDCVLSRLDHADRLGLVIYSGTVPLLGAPAEDAELFRCELCDEASGRKLSCAYRIKLLALR